MEATLAAASLVCTHVTPAYVYLAATSADSNMPSAGTPAYDASGSAAVLAATTPAELAIIASSLPGDGTTSTCRAAKTDRTDRQVELKADDDVQRTRLDVFGLAA